ncbi:MAG TPA: hypothetical protein VMG58_03960 [Candidatus Sulfotelmatobacter sp.]|nr:hypothetical protein [Candidatus Sulfotelmatobacter sp.]
MDRKRIPGASTLRVRRKPLFELAWALSLALGLAVSLPGVVGAEGGQGRFPYGVPDLLNPQTQGDWQSYQVGNLEGDPDFPLVIFLNQSGGAPAAVMIAIDARNGKSSWSLDSDPAILIALFADPKTLTGLYYDEGFTEAGRPSGHYAKITDPDSGALPLLLKSVVQAQHRVYM